MFLIVGTKINPEEKTHKQAVHRIVRDLGGFRLRSHPKNAHKLILPPTQVPAQSPESFYVSCVSFSDLTWACDGADRGIHQGEQQEQHLHKHSSEHPDFGEHPHKHSREQFSGFPLSDPSAFQAPQVFAPNVSKTR